MSVLSMSSYRSWTRVRQFELSIEGWFFTVFESEMPQRSLYKVFFNYRRCLLVPVHCKALIVNNNVDMSFSLWRKDIHSMFFIDYKTVLSAEWTREKSLSIVFELRDFAMVNCTNSIFTRASRLESSAFPISVPYLGLRNRQTKTKKSV